jgi:prophage regulatory protein
MNRTETKKTLLEKHWNTMKHNMIGTVADPLSRDTAEPVAILDEPKVEELTSLSRTTRWRMERRGDFPKRVRLSPGRVGWRQEEIEAWIRSRTA